MRPTSHKIELDKRVAEFMASGDLYSAIVSVSNMKWRRNTHEKP